MVTCLALNERLRFNDLSPNFWISLRKLKIFNINVNFSWWEYFLTTFLLPYCNALYFLRFTPWDDVEMEPYRQYLLGKRDLSENKKLKWRKHPVKNGLSWVKDCHNNSWFYLCYRFLIQNRKYPFWHIRGPIFQSYSHILFIFFLNKFYKIFNSFGRLYFSIFN